MPYINFINTLECPKARQLEINGRITLRPCV